MVFAHKDKTFFIDCYFSEENSGATKQSIAPELILLDNSPFYGGGSP